MGGEWGRLVNTSKSSWLECPVRETLEESTEELDAEGRRSRGGVEGRRVCEEGSGR